MKKNMLALSLYKSGTKSWIVCIGKRGYGGTVSKPKISTEIGNTSDAVVEIITISMWRMSYPILHIILNAFKDPRSMEQLSHAGG
ncbi:hypothetical protein [Paenibacillus sp. FSL L8-0499]|uniref:hypothetical protein n=1 Tax=Paenibacillus sp. FSL L8-0499 TaxID=2975334 RepID=UPI0030F9D329